MGYLTRNCILILVLTSSFVNPIFAQESNSSETTESSREKLLMLFAGEWVSRAIYTATKLEIADLLSTPKSIKELATLSETNPDSLHRLLRMLAGFNVFEEISEGVFANTESSRLLAKSNPDTLQALSLFYGEEIHKSWDDLPNSIKKGVPAFEMVYGQPVFNYFKENPSRAALFQEAMKEKTNAVAKSSISAYDFTSIRTVYDIGGGYGQFMIALLGEYPHLSGLIYEVPEVVKKIHSLDNDRLKIISGDFFKSVPKGGDLYILKSILHDWDDLKAEQILKNCHSAMNDDTRLLIIEVVLQPKDKSLYANCMDLLMLSVTGGKERSIALFNEIFDKAGFTLEKIYPTATEFSILELRKK